MTDSSADHSANLHARRSKIVEFHGEATSHPGWLYSVRLQALATNSDDILDDFDNPYKRDRRTSDSTADLQEAGTVRVRHLGTEFMPSDVLTKALGKVEHRRHSDVLLGRSQLEGA